MQQYSVAARIYAEATRLNPAETQYLLARATALIEEVVVMALRHPESRRGRTFYLPQRQSGS